MKFEMSNHKPDIGDASHRIKPSPDGASLVRATLVAAKKINNGDEYYVVN